jgi:hypothetical protein
MNRSLHVRIHLYQSIPQVRKFLNQNLRVERHGHEERSNTTLDWNQEDVGDLETDQESEGHDDSCEGIAFIVVWLGEGDIEVCEERADIRYEDGAHGEDRIDEAFVDKGIDTAVFHHCPGCLDKLVDEILGREAAYLCSWEIGLPVQSNV